MEADIQEFFSQRDGITGNGDADEAEAEAEAAGDMFSRCLTDFRDGLPEETKPSFRHYDSAEAMLADLRRLLVGKSGSRLMTCCSKVESFSRKLVPYFDVVNVFVQIKPDCIAGFWGSLMLICKVC